MSDETFAGLVGKWRTTAQDTDCRLHSGPGYTAHIPKYCPFCTITDCADELEKLQKRVEELREKWRGARTSKTVFLPAEHYAVIESCADELTAILGPAEKEPK